jgi:hypothetical protein
VNLTETGFPLISQTNSIQDCLPDNMEVNSEIRCLMVSSRGSGKIVSFKSRVCPKLGGQASGFIQGTRWRLMVEAEKLTDNANQSKK